MHEGLDGQKQRSALTAAEQALRALGTANAEKARKAAAKAADLDQIGVFSDFVAAVIPLADSLDRGEAIDDAGWDGLGATLGLSPLSGLIDELRG
jgi:hypothetical protein